MSLIKKENIGGIVNKTRIYDCNDEKIKGMCPLYCPKPTPFPYYCPIETTYPEYKPNQTNYPVYKPVEHEYPKYKPDETNYPKYKPDETNYPKYKPDETNYPKYAPQVVEYPKFVEKIVEIPICKCCSCDCGCDICEQQLKYVLEQMLSIYSEDNWIVNLEENRNVTGTPEALVTDINKGLLCFNGVLSTEKEQKIQYVNVCKISSIKITSAQFDATIQFLPDPVEESRCGCADSILKTMDKVPEGATVNINAGGQSTGESTIAANHIGMVVVESGNTVMFVNSCMIESFTVKNGDEYIAV